MYHTLKSLGKNFEVDFVKQLEKDVLKDIVKKEADLWIFTDLGSGQLETIKELIPKKPVIVCDHHPPTKACWNNLYHLNPHIVGIDGKTEISGAGVSYLLARSMTIKARKLIGLALVGAAGDMQKEHGRFKGINRLLLEDAELMGDLVSKKGLRMFGKSRPIHKALEQSTDPYIEGISNNESGAVQFLSEIGIPLKKRGRWRTLSDLTQKEEKTLATALILESHHNMEGNIIGKTYMLPNGHEIREFTTILNACGRAEKPLEGLKLCLGLENDAENILKSYKRKIAAALRWVNVNANSTITTKNATYIIAKNSISSNIIGTIVSIRIKYNAKTDMVFGFANAQNGVKVSGRRKKHSEELNLGIIIRCAAEKIGGISEGGGHSNAAGGKIPFGKEKEFIKELERLIEMHRKSHVQEKQSI